VWLYFRFCLSYRDVEELMLERRGVSLMMNGAQHYLWQAVDQEGHVLDILVKSRRNKQAAGKWLGRHLPRGPGWRPAPKSLGADFAGPCHPLTDGPLTDPQGLCNLALRPTLLLEVPGLHAPRFLSAVRYMVHA
jgi:hypothetical protein